MFKNLWVFILYLIKIEFGWLLIEYNAQGLFRFKSKYLDIGQLRIDWGRNMKVIYVFLIQAHESVS